MHTHVTVVAVVVVAVRQDGAADAETWRQDGNRI